MFNRHLCTKLLAPLHVRVHKHTIPAYPPSLALLRYMWFLSALFHQITYRDPKTTLVEFRRDATIPPIEKRQEPGTYKQCTQDMTAPTGTAHPLLCSCFKIDPAGKKLRIQLYEEALELVRSTKLLEAKRQQQRKLEAARKHKEKAASKRSGAGTIAGSLWNPAQYTYGRAAVRAQLPMPNFRLHGRDGIQRLEYMALKTSKSLTNSRNASTRRRMRPETAHSQTPQQDDDGRRRRTQNDNVPSYARLPARHEFDGLTPQRTASGTVIPRRARPHTAPGQRFRNTPLLPPPSLPTLPTRARGPKHRSASSSSSSSSSAAAAAAALLGAQQSRSTDSLLLGIGPIMLARPYSSGTPQAKRSRRREARQRMREETGR